MRILITAGPTREYFDSVRFMSNASSGRMGYAIAATAKARGHEVTLVSGPVSIAAPEVELISVVSAQEMYQASIEAFERCDVAIMTAAVCDWSPAYRSSHKQPKSEEQRTVLLQPTKDICATLGKAKGHRIVVGFAVQDEDAHVRAEQKMLRKNCDAIVLNAPSAMGDCRSRIEILENGGSWAEAVEGGKEELSSLIVSLVERLRAGKGRD